MERLTKIFWNEGSIYATHNLANSSLTERRKFQSFYGISPEVFTILWTRIRKKPAGSEPKHLLWCMLFLKNYNKEHLNAAIVKVDEKTFRLWTWRFVNCLAELSVVKWDNRLKNSNDNMHISLDGTDFRIREPIPFSKKWYSHKLDMKLDMKLGYHWDIIMKLGYHFIIYEIGISIVEGDIVLASGRLPCGDWPDIEIARDLYLHYSKNEKTLADKGYRDKKISNMMYV